MTIRMRLQKAEKAKRATTPEEIRVWIFDSRDGMHRRYAPGGELLECLNSTEWEERTRNEKVIDVRAADEPVKEIIVNLNYAENDV